MFYSQTFLARKGPLGTVWCAAHLQNRLKKSHYTSTDISSTVDCIMFPEVPIALRMSGHLLLGVVRIYSKKVDYLYHDCNVAIFALKKAFASTEVNLPENATTAKFEAVTLPQTFDLDEFDIDVDFDPNRFNDHTRSLEDITLQDQIHTNFEPFVVITFEKDILQPEPDGLQNSNIAAENVGEDQTTDRMDTDHLEESDRTELINDPGHSKERGDFITETNGENSPPSFEIRRDQHVIPENNSLIDNLQNDISDKNQLPNLGLDEEEIFPPFEETPSLQNQSPPFFRSPESSHEPSRIDNNLGLSGDLAVIRSSPQVQPLKPSKRKRKIFFDESTVLTNKFMKKALDNYSDIKRRKKDIPCTALGIWRMNYASRKEQVFSEPLFTGLCPEICNLHKNDFISTKPHLILEREVTPEPIDIPSNAEASTFIPENESPSDIEIEIFRDADGVESNRFVYPPGLTPPFRKDELTSPNLSNSFGLDSVNPTEPSVGISGPHLHEHSAVTETPFTDFNTGHHNTPFDIPEIHYTAQTEDLSFLEEDNNISGSQGTQGIDSLSARTRAVAQYVLRQSPIASISEDQPEDLSLNKILEGKTRKICARMFFETLVLKTYGLIDVRQEQPYGDISLKPTSMLAKSQF